MAVTISAGTGEGKALLVGFDPRRQTQVRRGENAGRTILQANIVRSVQSVADRHGREIKATAPLPVVSDERHGLLGRSELLVAGEPKGCE